jgi:DNA-binding NtrC family response regulator
MARIPSLGPSERERFDLVARAAFANPFSEERDELDYRIIGERCAPEIALERLLGTVSDLARELMNRGRGRLDQFTPSDRPLVEIVLLFDAFHRFILPLDEHIEAQETGGEEPIPAPFARPLLGLLGERGFPPAMARRHLELFFQLRRAFHFIQRRLVGHAPCMRRLRMHLWNNVFSHDLAAYDAYLQPRMEDFSTMLLGETGSGKGAAAAAIGRSGYIPFDEKRGRFVESFTHAFTAINLSQYPETLIESELFGHKKGAFTGAIESHRGVFSRCSPHGVLFLDEIAEIGVPVQVKLLKVLEDRRFTPLGSHAVERFGGRVIVATNRPLAALRQSGAFRDELFYRVSSDIIHFPPLRERIAEEPAELEALVLNAVRMMTGEAEAKVGDRVAEAIRDGVGRAYDWPGNVREVEQAVRSVLLTGRYEGDPAADDGAHGGDEALVRRMAEGTFDADGLLSEYAALLHRRHGTYEEVARRMKLDRRTVKKYLTGRPG